MGIAGVLHAKGTDVACVGPDTSVEVIVAEMNTRRIGAMLVIEGESVVGLVSERDVIRALAGHREQVLSLAARDIMTTPVLTIAPGDSVVAALALMTDRRVRHLPVVDSGHLAGLVSIGDLVKARIEAIEREARALRDYITTA